jgi:impB/mucB/samB family
VDGSVERGVVAAASYEARKFGVRSAMPSVTAKRQCADLIFVKPRFEVYKAISRQIREIFAEHTPIIKPLSLDEAYLDVTENLQSIPLARDIALRIREKVKAETGLNAGRHLWRWLGRTAMAPAEFGSHGGSDWQCPCNSIGPSRTWKYGAQAATAVRS